MATEDENDTSDTGGYTENARKQIKENMKKSGVDKYMSRNENERSRIQKLVRDKDKTFGNTKTQSVS